MSGPVTAIDASPAVANCSHPSAPCIEVTDSREEQVGRIRVRRALPRKGRRTVGAWCFADHMGPADVTENSGLDVGPHPHIGLQTVIWLIDGQVLHRDSLGSEQVIKPGSST
jgi:redox-sensitive bicupin YhaK (pirin superfamily)